MLRRAASGWIASLTLAGFVATMGAFGCATDQGGSDENGEDGEGGADGSGTGGDGNGSGASNGDGSGGSNSGSGASSSTGGSDPGPPPDQDEDGWTVFEQGDANIYYVSSSEGSADGSGSEDDPFATYEQAFEASAEGDWILLKRGDTFTDSISAWRNGLSRTQPFVIGAYGDEADPRPVVDPAGGPGFRAQGGSSSPDTIEHVAVLSIHFRQSMNDPNSDAWTGTPSTEDGIRILRTGNDVLFEDVMVEKFGTNLNIQSDVDGSPLANVVLRRSVILDAYRQTAEGHSQGMFFDDVANPIIEENVIDHNGWHESVPDAHKTKFNHNIYMQRTCTNPIVRNNIIARGSSHGFQLRPSGTAEGNVLIANSIAGFVANDNIVDLSVMVMTGNVVLHGNRDPLGVDGADGILGWGLELIYNDDEVTIVPDAGALSFIDNIIAHGDPGSRNAERVADEYLDLIGLDNVVYDWGDDESDAGPFVDPSRTIMTYQEGKGDESIEGFMEAARAMRRYYWTEDYQTEVVRAYFEEGFALE